MTPAALVPALGDQVVVRGDLDGVFGEGTGVADWLRTPTGAGRGGNGDIVVTSLLSEELTLVPDGRGSPPRVLRTSLHPLEGLWVLGDETVLLNGPDAPYAKHLLHIFNLSTGELLSSFFAPPAHVDSNVTLVLGRVYTAIRHGRLAVVHSLSDSLLFFSLDGIPQGGVRLPVEHSNVPKGPLPAIESPAKRREWADQWTLVAGVFWLDDEHLLVQWVRGRRSQAVHWLAQVDTSGRIAWTEARTPRLLTVRGEQYFFQDLLSGVPNRVLVAVRKQG